MNDEMNDEMNKMLLVVGDYNQEFKNNSNDVYASFLFNNGKYKSLNFTPIDKRTMPENALIRRYRSGEMNPLSDHSISNVQVFDDVTVTVWNANCKVHNQLSNTKQVLELIDLKKKRIIKLMNQPNSHIIVLNEWGNEKLNRYKYKNDQLAFQHIYGPEAFRKLGVSICAMRKYLNKKENTDKVTWVMFTGVAGKVILFKQTIVDQTKIKMAPIKMDYTNPIANLLLSRMNLRNNKDERSNIFTNIIPLYLKNGNMLYITGVHDTAKGAYSDNYPDSKRWNDRVKLISKWFGYIKDRSYLY